MAEGYFTKRINFHVRRANFLEGTAARRHARAARVAKRALAAQANGHYQHAIRLIHRALRWKAMAVRAAHRGQKHLARVAHLRQQSAAKRAG